MHCPNLANLDQVMHEPLKADIPSYGTGMKMFCCLRAFAIDEHAHIVDFNVHQFSVHLTITRQ